MRFLRVDLIQTSADLRTREPAHRAHELVYVLTPGYRVRVAGKTYAGQPGDLFLYPAGCSHTPLLRRDLNARFYAVQWEEQNADLRRYPLRTFDATGRLLVLLRWVWELCPAATGADRRLLQALWTAALAEHRRLALAKPTSFGDRVSHYMARDLHRPLTLLELAKSEGVSRFHLIRRFRRETGKTPGQYLQQLRVQRAFSLLTTTGEPLKTIARAVGFASPTHLAALIRRATGRLPGSFRKQRHGGSTDRKARGMGQD